MGATALLAHRYTAFQPQSAAIRLQGMPARETAAFLTDAETETAASVLKMMWPGRAAAVLDHFTIDRKVRVLEKLDLTTIVVFLRQLTEDSRAELIDALPESFGRRVRQALASRPGTAGFVVDSTVTAFDADTTVSEARARGSDPRLPYLYVVSPEHQLVGVVHRRDLERSDDSATLRSLMNARVQTVPATTSVAGLLGHNAWSTFDALPVVGARGVFLGVIRHKSLRSKPGVKAGTPASATAVTALLDLGEVYWSGLFSAIETFASAGRTEAQGDTQ